MGNEAAVQQSTKGLTLFPVPAHILARITARGSGNMVKQSTTNSLTFGGKEWVMTVNGTKKVLDRPVIVQIGNEWKPDPSGAKEPLQQLNVVVVDQSKQGREFYEGEYNPANARAPDCWSADGRKPHPNVEEPQCDACELCEQNKVGSRATAKSPKGKACRAFKLLAVLPIKSDGAIRHDFPVLRMKLSPTCIWDTRDEESMAAGWYAWDNYTKHLTANNVMYSGEMVTQLRFASVQTDRTHPQVQFARGAWLEQEDADKLFERSKSEEVKNILSGFTPRTARAAEPPKGKPLPEDDEPTPEQIAAEAQTH